VPARPLIDAAELARWCREQFGCAPAAELFRTGYLSAVVGLRLLDGREVVVKVRAPAQRLLGCFEVQRRLFESGFRCPEPLVGPTPLGGYVATAERHLPGGTLLPDSGRAAAPFAEALAALMASAPSSREVPSLAPAPPWTAWNHGEGELWPWPDDRAVDLNRVAGPAWVDDAARAVHLRLSESTAEQVIGHGDWYAANLRWDGDSLWAAHDWDSAISERETVIVGLAAAVFPATGGPGEEASVDETADFMNAYTSARGRAFSSNEVEEMWAAGVWVRAFDAKKQLVTDGAIHALTEPEAQERRRQAGIT
jgi:hypothetical protein